jgi:hypothetical protein
MDISTLAAWGEFIGGIGVIASLIYLASQIRQNSKLLRSSTASATTAVQTDPSRLMVQDPEVARIFWDGVADRASLSREDLRRFDPLVGMSFSGWNQEYQFASDDVIGEIVWGSRTKFIRRIMRQPGMRQWWNEWRDIYGDEFGGFIDGLIREGEAAG